MKLVEILAVGIIRAYQWFLRPVLPMSCRYWPSCSEYAIEAVRRHGPLRGGWLSAGRLARCHPWGGDGFDPVPERFRFFPRRRGPTDSRDTDCGSPNHNHI